MPIVAKLDELGRPAWIALMILGFVVWWPVGLATLAFIIGSGRMSCWKSGGMSRWHGCAARADAQSPGPGGSRRDRAATGRSTNTAPRPCSVSRRSSANSATSSTRLRLAKDKAEFDQFMAERRSRGTAPSSPPSQTLIRLDADSQ